MSCGITKITRLKLMKEIPKTYNPREGLKKQIANKET